MHVALAGPEIEDTKVEFEYDDGEVEYEIETYGLPEGEVVTVWLAGFNHPENCAGPSDLTDGSGLCGLTDWISPETYEATGIFWKNAGGIIVDETGEFEIENIDDPNIPTEFGPQLDIETAEIHIWVRTHGLPIPDRLEEQLTQSLGGCDVQTCTDLQIAVIPAP